MRVGVRGCVCEDELERVCERVCWRGCVCEGVLERMC